MHESKRQLRGEWRELTGEIRSLLTMLRIRISPRLRRERREAIDRYKVYRSSDKGDLYRSDGRFRSLMEVHAVAIDMAELRQSQLSTMMRRNYAAEAGVRDSPYTVRDCELVAAEAIRWWDMALRMDGKLPPADPVSIRIDEMIARA